MKSRDIYLLSVVVSVMNMVSDIITQNISGTLGWICAAYFAYINLLRENGK